MFFRLLTLILKELQSILGNKQGRIMLIMPVILQTAVFPFAATLEVKHSTVAIYNQDGGAASIELVQRLSRAQAFSGILMLHSEGEVRQAIDNQDALLAILLPPDFSQRVLAQQTAPLQIIIDGRRSNSAQIASGYATQVFNTWAAEQAGVATPGVATPGVATPGTLTVRHLYNPNLEYQWHILPSLVAIITTIGCLMVSGLSVAREREEGTFDQLLVSPLSPAWIMAGKAVPGMLVALLQGSIIVLAGVFVYRVPFTGSLSLLFVSTLCYGLALAGVGLFISSFCATQQQAFLGMFSFIVPAVILSGYVTPIENMPPVLQWLASINPLTYFIVILKGVFLKDLRWAASWSYLWPLLAIAAVTLSVALRMFRRHIA